MPKLRVHNFSMSLDGYVAGPHQDLDNPLGVGGEQLHEWVFQPDRPDIDDRFIAEGDAGIGATIMGRNMFGPIRGEWGDTDWKGWWGDTPPYQHEVFVFTHHPHDPIPMNGGTTFNFVDDPIEAVLERAFAAAAGQDVRLGGGASTVQQYMRAGLVDELHIPIVPVLLGGGERLFEGVDAAAIGYECVEVTPSGDVTHIRLAKA